MPLAAGTQLGPYRIVSLLGSGGMGEVYRADDVRLHRTVAIKILSPDVATPERVQRFEQEARAASALNHPNILTIHDVGREGDTAYLAMEWVEGQTLRELMRAGPIPLRRTLQLAPQIADGLAKAHIAGIVHRDLKPENVMVTSDGLAKIVDFGLAKLNAPAALAGDADHTVTRIGGTEPGMVMGTVGYMSPEQASGRPADYRSDQFALGLLIYEMLTRTRPFQRPTTAQSLAATIEADPAPIEMLNPDVPPHLTAIVTRLLAKDPAERYESTRDLARDLRSVTETSSKATDVTTPTQPLRGRRGSLGALAAVIILVAIAATLWLGRTPSAPVVTAPTGPLLAVRPFRSLSADSQQGYFAAGVTEEIRGQLSQIASLRLLSRNGLDAYKDDVARAVRELGVQHFVDGSVRVEGIRVRVSAELIDAAKQQTVWSNQYDRELADVLTVQSEIAQQIARALDAKLSPSEQQRLTKRLTENPEAYALYLKARQADVTDRAHNLEMLEMLRQAIALDPRFATAQAYLGFRLISMGYYDDPSYIDKGIAEAHSALRIDPLLPSGYFALGTGYGMKGLVAQARQAFLRALELNPNHVGAMLNFSIEELNNGRYDEATYWGRRGFGLSGKAGNDFYHLVIPLVPLRADAEARVLLEEAERRAPTFHRVQMLLSMIEHLEGHADRAVARADALAARLPTDEEVRFYRGDLAFLLDSPDLETWLAPLMERSAANNLWVAETVRMRYAYALAKRGQSARAASLVAEAERIAHAKIDAGNESPMLRVELAAGAALRKDTNGAFEWLGRAFDTGYRDYTVVERDPIFRNAFGTDARFRDLVERMRRDVDAQRARARDRGLLELESLLRTDPSRSNNR